MSTTPFFPLMNTFEPAPGAPIWLASWDGFSGLASLTADHQPIFATGGSAWLAVADMTLLTLYGEVPAVLEETAHTDPVTLGLAGLAAHWDERRAS